MPTSAGLLVHRKAPGGLEVLLGHPGGPVWRRRDEGAWTCPKGLIEADEAPLAAAFREFAEETGLAPAGEARALRPVRLKSGKRLICFALEADLDLSGFRSALVPSPFGGAPVPELDRIAYFPLGTARLKINVGQLPLLEELRSWIEPHAPA